MEKSLEDRNMFVLIVIPNFLILIRKKLFVQTVKQKIIIEKSTYKFSWFKIKRSWNRRRWLELSKEVEFDDNELNEVLENDTSLKKE